MAGFTGAARAALWRVCALLVLLGGASLAADNPFLPAQDPVPLLAAIDKERPAFVPPAGVTGISVPHHLLDVWPLEKSAAVAEYQARARAAIVEIHGRGRLPILVGGSGLYLRGALDDLEFPGEDAAVRAGLYAAPPAHGPSITLICGMTPDALVLRWKIPP